jgi:hypothetical protein
MTTRPCAVCGGEMHLVTCFPTTLIGKEPAYQDRDGRKHKHPAQYIEWKYWCGTKMCPIVVETEPLDLFCCQEDE